MTGAGELKMDIAKMKELLAFLIELGLSENDAKLVLLESTFGPRDVFAKTFARSEPVQS